MVTNRVDDVTSSRGAYSRQDTRACILLADDDTEMRALLALALQAEGYEVVACTDGIQLLQHLYAAGPPDASQRFDLIITDLRMPGVSGLAVLEQIHGRSEIPPTILITAFGDEHTHILARQLGATVSVDKPFEILWFLDLVRDVLSSPA
jgi:DNA-binding response OmpR family regulator